MRDARQYVDLGMAILTPRRAREMARSLMGEEGRDQMARILGEFLEWSERSRERMKELVQAEVRKQLEALGLATRDDVDALRKRIRDLEKERPRPRKPTARKEPAKKAGTARA